MMVMAYDGDGDGMMMVMVEYDAHLLKFWHHEPAAYGSQVRVSSQCLWVVQFSLCWLFVGSGGVDGVDGGRDGSRNAFLGRRFLGMVLLWYVITVVAITVVDQVVV